MWHERPILAGETSLDELPLQSIRQQGELGRATPGSHPQRVRTAVVGKDPETLERDVERRKTERRTPAGLPSRGLPFERFFAQKTERVMRLLRRDEPKAIATRVTTQIGAQGPQGCLHITRNTDRKKKPRHVLLASSSAT